MVRNRKQYEMEWTDEDYELVRQALETQRRAETLAAISLGTLAAYQAVMDGADPKALDAVADRLASRFGIVLQQPAYSRYYHELGEISSYPPGYKENAGIFCHNNPWIMIAETMLGRGDRAYDYYRRIAPAFLDDQQEIHRAEPYVYAQMIAGPDAAHCGQAKTPGSPAPRCLPSPPVQASWARISRRPTWR